MKLETLQLASQISEVFKSMPNFEEFDVEVGDTTYSAGKHVLPGLAIGGAIATFRDSYLRRIPTMKNTLICGIGTMVAGLAYEGVDACADGIPGVSGIDQCKVGYLDGSTLQHANIDSIIDVAITGGTGILSAFAVSSFLYSRRKKKQAGKFYKATHDEIMELYAMDMPLDEKDKNIIDVV